jgi:Asp-tRNA(Asn)/Glu-tRNA(Gln) amidotransferase A subunit family amidase
MTNLNRLSASELAERLRAREVRAIDVVEACLARIAERDATIHAWVAVDEEGARRQARALDTGPIVGPLHGVPIAIKDIIDTADLPTEYGSPIYRGHRPAADAGCVALARAAGAVVLGKTASAEFATFSPATTVNPHNFAHTPGGSSSGSAAAVADAMAPLAFGTQTAGSIIRPASFCGVVGYKPTYGTVSRAGVKLVAESLDTVGVLTRTISDAGLLVGVMTAREDLLELPRVDARLRIGLCLTHDWHEVTPAVGGAMQQAAKLLAASGAHVGEAEMPTRFAALRDAHAAILGYESARNLAHERREHRSRLSPRLRSELDAGARIAATRYDSAQLSAHSCRLELPDLFAEHDVLLAPSAIGEAPAGLQSTGSPVMNLVWTLLHVPCVNVPFARGPTGLPIGLQVIGPRGDDARTLAAAEWIFERLASGA